MRRLILAILVTVSVFFSSVVYGQDTPAEPVSKKEEQKKERYVPEFFRADLNAKPSKFVSDETVVIEGVVVFDQVFTVHWDEIAAERLKLDPFRVLNVAIGPQRPSGALTEIFADERTLRLVLEFQGDGKDGRITIPAITLSYSWQDGGKTVVKKARVGPWVVERVPIKVNAVFSSGVLHLGEKAELTIRVVQEKGIRVLNRMIKILDDETAPETQKSEVRRWLKSLEVRNDSAFNFDSPDLKPFTVLGRNIEEVYRNGSVVSNYRYTVAYYGEVKSSVKMPDIKVWYMRPYKGGADKFGDPESVSLSGFVASIASRISGKDRVLDGPAAPRVTETNDYLRYIFDYGLFGGGVLFLVSGAALIASMRRSMFGEKRRAPRPVNFSEASRELILFFNSVADGGKLSDRSVKVFRERVFDFLGAVIGLTLEEARTKSADEMIGLLEMKYDRRYIMPVIEMLNWLDCSLSLSEAPDSDGVEFPEKLVREVMPYVRGRGKWYALAQI